MPQAGDNSDKLIKDYAKRIADFMDQIAEIKADVALERKAAKNAGLDVKALNKVVREMGLDAEKMEKQLLFDFEVDAYRKAVGLPTEIKGETAEAA